MPAADEEHGIEQGEHGQANERHPLARILEEEAAEGHGHEAADGQARDHEAHGARPLALLREQVGEHGEAAGGGDGAAEALEGARGEEPVEGGCVGEDEGGGEVDEEAGEHWRVVAEVVDERAHERVHEQLHEGLGGEEEADRDVVAVVLEAHVGVYHCPLGF